MLSAQGHARLSTQTIELRRSGCTPAWSAAAAMSPGSSVTCARAGVAERSASRASPTRPTARTHQAGRTPRASEDRILLSSIDVLTHGLRGRHRSRPDRAGTPRASEDRLLTQEPPGEHVDEAADAGAGEAG